MINGFKAAGRIHLSAAEVQSLADRDVANGDDGSAALMLDGLTYKRLASDAPTSADKRLAWLQRQPSQYLGSDFRPQPFGQLAQVLRAMGHDRDAREIGFLKEKLFRPQRACRARCIAKPFVWVQWVGYGLIAGYGYKPHRILWILFAVWLVSAMVYWQAARQGIFAPADAEIRSQASTKTCLSPEGNLTICPDSKVPPLFQALLYSGDVLIPIFDLGQRNHWVMIKHEASSNSRLSLSLPYIADVSLPVVVVPWLVATENVLGTLLVLLFGAIVSGIVKRD